MVFSNNRAADPNYIILENNEITNTLIEKERKGLEKNIIRLLKY